MDWSAHEEAERREKKGKFASMRTRPWRADQDWKDIASMSCSPQYPCIIGSTAISRFNIEMRQSVYDRL
jgi:hypothetical protein